MNLKITGRDNTPPDLQWLRITGDNVIQAKLIDGSAVRNIKAKLILRTKPDSYLEFELKDDGRNGDRADNDDVFSFKVPEQKFGLYNVEVTATDAFGNMMTKTAPGIFVIH